MLGGDSLWRLAPAAVEQSYGSSDARALVLPVEHHAQDGALADARLNDARTEWDGLIEDKIETAGA